MPPKPSSSVFPSRRAGPSFRRLLTEPTTHKGTPLSCLSSPKKPAHPPKVCRLFPFHIKKRRTPRTGAGFVSCPKQSRRTLLPKHACPRAKQTHTNQGKRRNHARKQYRKPCPAPFCKTQRTPGFASDARCHCSMKDSGRENTAHKSGSLTFVHSAEPPSSGP